MNSIKVIKVQSKKEMKMFISFPHTLYQKYDNYVPDLDSDVEGFFNPKKNRNLAYADVQPFLAMRDGEVVGRIAGVVSHKSNSTWNKRIVRFTYIEFIDDLDVSKALLDTVAEWGKSFGMNEIQGPMGIIDFDKEGMLIEDFDLPGCFMEFWNPPYYKSHMEQLGFKKGADWLQIRFEVPEQIPPRFQRVADYSKQEFGVHVVRKTKKEITQGYSHKIFKLLNESFAQLYGFAPFSEEQAEEVLARFLPFLDMDMVPIVEDNKGELVGIAVTCRDFSDGIKKKNMVNSYPLDGYICLKP